MGLRGRKQRRREEVEAEVRAALAEFAAAVEVRLHAELDRSRQTQLAVIDAVRALRRDFEGRDAALTQALEGLGHVITQAAAEIGAAAAERRALVEALTRAASPGAIAAPVAHARERVIGGTVYGGTVGSEPSDAGSAPDAGAAAHVDVAADVEVVADDDPALVPGLPVQCRFGDRWVAGFEISDVVDQAGWRRYRVRRASDGAALPQLFTAEEVRSSRSPRDESAPASSWVGRSRAE